MRPEMMGKAGKALASARILLGAGDSDGATNRAYYAMFDAATAAPCLGRDRFDARSTQNPQRTDRKLWVASPPNRTACC